MKLRYFFTKKAKINEPQLLWGRAESRYMSPAGIQKEMEDKFELEKMIQGFKSYRETYSVARKSKGKRPSEGFLQIAAMVQFILKYFNRNRTNYITDNKKEIFCNEYGVKEEDLLNAIFPDKQITTEEHDAYEQWYNHQLTVTVFRYKIFNDNYLLYADPSKDLDWSTKEKRILKLLLNNETGDHRVKNDWEKICKEYIDQQEYFSAAYKKLEKNNQLSMLTMNLKEFLKKNLTEYAEIVGIEQETPKKQDFLGEDKANDDYRDFRKKQEAEREERRRQELERQRQQEEIRNLELRKKEQNEKIAQQLSRDTGVPVVECRIALTDTAEQDGSFIYDAGLSNLKKKNRERNINKLYLEFSKDIGKDSIVQIYMDCQENFDKTYAKINEIIFNNEVLKIKEKNPTISESEIRYILKQYGRQNYEKARLILQTAHELKLMDKSELREAEDILFRQALHYEDLMRKLRKEGKGPLNSPEFREAVESHTKYYNQYQKVRDQRIGQKK